MIGRITGKILAKIPPKILIDVNGLGYEVESSMQTFYQLPENQTEITLHTHFIVREDCQLLFGFYQIAERDLFRLLIRVNGIGPKLALAILSSLSPQEFVTLVQQNDAAKLAKLPGIGKKTSERLLIEMRDKLKSWQDQHQIAISLQTEPAEQEAIAVLVALGYKEQEAQKTLRKIQQPGLTSENLIRLALQTMLR